MDPDIFRLVINTDFYIHLSDGIDLPRIHNEKRKSLLRLVVNTMTRKEQFAVLKQNYEVIALINRPTQRQIHYACMQNPRDNLKVIDPKYIPLKLLIKLTEMYNRLPDEYLDPFDFLTVVPEPLQNYVLSRDMIVDISKFSPENQISAVNKSMKYFIVYDYTVPEKYYIKGSDHYSISEDLLEKYESLLEYAIKKNPGILQSLLNHPDINYRSFRSKLSNLKNVEKYIAAYPNIVAHFLRYNVNLSKKDPEYKINNDQNNRLLKLAIDLDPTAIKHAIANPMFDTFECCNRAVTTRPDFILEIISNHEFRDYLSAKDLKFLMGVAVQFNPDLIADKRIQTVTTIKIAKFYQRRKWFMKMLDICIAFYTLDIPYNLLIDIFDNLYDHSMTDYDLWHVSRIAKGQEIKL